MPSYSPAMKLCATCALWGGARQVNPTRAFVTTQTPTTKGECMGGGHNRAQTPATGTCSKYVKLQMLR